MIILSIDSSTPVAGAAVLDEAKLLGESMLNTKNTHSEKLLVMVDTLSLIHISKRSLESFMAFLIAAAVSGALITTPLPSTILLWSIFYSICSDLNFAKRSRYVTISMVGMVVAGYAGAALFPYSPMTQLQLGLLLQIDPTLKVNYMAYILTVLLFNIALIAAMVIFVRCV